MKNNEVFNEIRRACEEWEAAKDEYAKQKHEIIKKFGCDSPEYKAWKAEQKENPFPISRGAMTAFHTWENNIEKRTDEFEFDGFTCDDESKDFIDTLRKAGIKTIVLTCASTALIENLHTYAEEGCTVDGLAVVTRKNDWGRTREQKGIRLRIN